jgi:heptosyltransferase-2
MERRVKRDALPLAAAAPPPPAAEVHRIGCLMLNGVGDILCCLPALDALKERYPQARVVAIVRPHLADLVRTHPSVDEVLGFGYRSLRERLAFFRALRRARFDLWVDLHTPTFNTVTSNARHFIRNALLLLWSGARYGRAYASPPLGPLLTHPLPHPPREALTGLNIVELTLPLGWPLEGRRYEKRMGMTDADRRWAEQALPGATRRIGLYFGTRQPAKLWPEAAMVRFAAMVLQRWPEAEAVLIGDATDVERARVLRESLPPGLRARVRDLTGGASFCQTAAALARCDAVVSSDSGPMHIADAVGVPMVAIFSSHNYPKVWAPMNARAVVIHHDIECGPCWKAECPVGNRCMANITPEEVLEALAQKLA